MLGQILNSDSPLFILSEMSLYSMEFCFLSFYLANYLPCFVQSTSPGSMPYSYFGHFFFMKRGMCDIMG